MKTIKKLIDYGLNTKKRTYVIAEVGINHGGDILVAKQLIESAAKTGADAVKFQTYITEQRAPKGNRAIFDILKKCELSFPAFAELNAHAAKFNIDFFSTPFDMESLKYLESIRCPMYKVASFDVVNRQLLKAIADTGKPAIMSVGMARMEEIKEAYDILISKGGKVALLHCLSAYPLKEEDANLAAIYALQEAFDCVIGYSDHTIGLEVPLYAVAAGAQIIEKHFMMNSQLACADAPVSVTEKQMTALVQAIRHIEQMFGDGELGLRPAENGIEIFRRATQ